MDYNDLYEEIVNTTFDDYSNSMQMDQEYSENKDQLLNLINYDENESKNFDKKILNLLTIKTESNKLKTAVVTFAILIIIFGILFNTIFNIILVVRKRYTVYNLIKISMCTSYLFYLIFYCFKISVYVNDITKYHVYDTLETWSYGKGLCQFINGLLPTCKFISRFSILLLCIKHLIVTIQLKNSSKYNNYNDFDDDGTSCKLSNLIRRPYINVTLGFIWIFSILISLPIYFKYKLTPIHDSKTYICDCVYEYPDDNSKFALVLFNYLIFGCILPCIFIIICLISTLGLNLIYNIDYDGHGDSERKLYLLVIIIFLIHLITTLPQDVYKYVLLISKDHLNEETGIMQSVIDQLTQPLTQAKFYYYLQFLYISEFFLVPFVFLLFYVLNIFSGVNSLSKTHYNVTNISSNSGSRENLKDLTDNSHAIKTNTNIYIQHSSIDQQQQKILNQTDDFDELLKAQNNLLYGLSTNTSLSSDEQLKKFTGTTPAFPKV